MLVHPCVFGLIKRERQAYVSIMGVSGRAYVTDKDGNLGRALSVKEKPLRFALRELFQKSPKNLIV